MFFLSGKIIMNVLFNVLYLNPLGKLNYTQIWLTDINLMKITQFYLLAAPLVLLIYSFMMMFLTMLNHLLILYLPSIIFVYSVNGAIPVIVLFIDKLCQSICHLKILENPFLDRIIIGVNIVLYMAWIVEYCVSYFRGLGIGLIAALLQAIFNTILLIWILFSSTDKNLPGPLKQILAELFNILSHYLINVVTIVYYLVALHMPNYIDSLTVLTVMFPFGLFNGIIMLESCIKIFLQLNLFRIELESKVEDLNFRKINL